MGCLIAKGERLEIVSINSYGKQVALLLETQHWKSKH